MTRTEFDKGTKASLKFANEIVRPYLLMKLRWKPKEVVGLANIDYSKQVGYVSPSRLRYKCFFSKGFYNKWSDKPRKEHKIQFYIGKKRYGSKYKYYLYAWDTVDYGVKEMYWGYTHFRFEPAIPDKILKKLEI